MFISGALSALYPLRPKLISIETDGQGMIPENLEKVLKNWNSDSPKPKVEKYSFFGIIIS